MGLGDVCSWAFKVGPSCVYLNKHVHVIERGWILLPKYCFSASSLTSKIADCYSRLRLWKCWVKSNRVKSFGCCWHVVFRLVAVRRSFETSFQVKWWYLVSVLLLLYRKISSTDNNNCSNKMILKKRTLIDPWAKKYDGFKSSEIREINLHLKFNPLSWVTY